jgi:hypothetical protein
MGYELWTSPITGYRRRGTRLVELRSVLGAGITARSILEPLQSCPADASAAEMADLLRRRDFDVAGVKAVQDGPVIGFVERDGLTSGLVRDHRKEITADHLVSDATDLPRLLSHLKGRQYAFVSSGPSVEGIVTRADLNKPPVRVYLFGLVSLLEMHLAFWITDGYPSNSWEGKLKRVRLDAAKDVQRMRRRGSEEPALFECLQFCDKRDLVLGHPELPSKMGMGLGADALESLRQAESLRNDLAHSQRDLAGGSSWEEVIGLVEWMETVVQVSDERVESRAENGTGRAGADLWAPTRSRTAVPGDMGRLTGSAREAEMGVWSEWRSFPDPRLEGYLVAPLGPGVYELRNRDTGQLVLFGRSKHCASRMSSLLPDSGGTRKNYKKRNYVLEHLSKIEYRTRPFPTDGEAAAFESELRDGGGGYIFGT